MTCMLLAVVYVSIHATIVHPAACPVRAGKGGGRSNRITDAVQEKSVCSRDCLLLKSPPCRRCHNHLHISKDRQLAREAGAAVRQDLFEVGEEGMAVGELAQTLAVNASEVVKILFMKGLMVTVNQARRQHTPTLCPDVTVACHAASLPTCVRW